MKFNVHMVAFHNPIRVREVSPDIHELKACSCNADILEAIFKYGQNDFQPQTGFCSVSVGDVVELPQADNFVKEGGALISDLAEELLEEITGEGTSVAKSELYVGDFSLPEDWQPELWIVGGCGFTKLTQEQFEAHKSMPMEQRSMNAYRITG